jgi:hypothetical protein
MNKGHLLAVATAFVISVKSIGAQEFPALAPGATRDLLISALGQLERFTELLDPARLRFLADGGTDGGGSTDGGSGASGAAGAAAGAAGAGAAGAVIDLRWMNCPIKIIEKQEN